LIVNYCLTAFFLSAASLGVGSEDLLFVRAGGVYLLAGEGGSARLVVRGSDPALSPDGKSIVYTEPRRYNRDDAKNATISVFNLTSEVNQAILRPGAIVSQPCWDRKGSRIAFVMEAEGGRKQVHVMGAAGGGRRRVVAEGEQEVAGIFGLEWGPGEDEVSFHDLRNWYRVSLEGKVTAVALATITGRSDRMSSRDRVVVNPERTDLVAYTMAVPGTTLFERTFHDPNTALFTYDLKRGVRRRLTAPEQLARDPVWSRDGRGIYFSGFRDRDGRDAARFRIYRIGSDGGEPLELVRGEAPCRQ
jgi:Tol biopolymer transport system component